MVIPVKNGAATLERCLASLRQQTVGNEMEIVVADSMSSDGSREIAARYGAKLFDVAEGNFDHGLTRNLGAKHCNGELVFFTVQDAWLAEVDMLQKMAAHFADHSVMAVVGHQAVPHERDKNPMLWYRPVSKPAITVKEIRSEEWFEALPQQEQQALVSWDNVVAMYRKMALREQPFVKTAFAEDWIWNYQALMKGWKTLHDSGLVVYHYHHHAYRYAFRSKFTVNYHFKKFLRFEPSMPRLFMPVAKSIYHLAKHDSLSWKEKIYWMQYNLVAAMAEVHSVFDFRLRAWLGGEKLLESGYRRYCRSIPQGKQKRR